MMKQPFRANTRTDNNANDISALGSMIKPFRANTRTVKNANDIGALGSPKRFHSQVQVQLWSDGELHITFETPTPVKVT